jgi:hypothetical protein
MKRTADRIGRAIEHDRAAYHLRRVAGGACRCRQTCAEFALSPESLVARVEELFEIPVVEPEAMPDEDIILVILRRLVAGRALLGYELAAERGLLSEESLAAKVTAFHAGTPENVDPERVAWLLAGLLGEMPEPDVVELCSSDLGDAVERAAAAERREELVSVARKGEGERTWCGARGRRRSRGRRRRAECGSSLRGAALGRLAGALHGRSLARGVGPPHRVCGLRDLRPGVSSTSAYHAPRTTAPRWRWRRRRRLSTATRDRGRADGAAPQVAVLAGRRQKKPRSFQTTRMVRCREAKAGDLLGR